MNGLRWCQHIYFLGDDLFSHLFCSCWYMQHTSYLTPTFFVCVQSQQFIHKQNWIVNKRGSSSFVAHMIICLIKHCWHVNSIDLSPNKSHKYAALTPERLDMCCETHSCRPVMTVFDPGMPRVGRAAAARVPELVIAYRNTNHDCCLYACFSGGAAPIFDCIHLFIIRGRLRFFKGCYYSSFIFLVEDIEIEGRPEMTSLLVY